MSQIARFCLILLFGVIPVQTKAAPPVPVQLKVERVGDMVHFEFMGQKRWDYQLKKNKNILEMSVPKVREQDLETLKSHKDLLVHHVDVVDENTNRTLLKIHLNDSQVESFDYLTQDPSHLVVDLFAGNDKIIKSLKAKYAKRLKFGDAPIVAKKKSAKKTKKVADSKGLKKKKANRRPAFAEFLFTSEDETKEPPVAMEEQVNIGEDQGMDELFDFSQVQFGDDNSLEAKVIEAQGNIYLRFPILVLPNRHLEQLEKFVPKYEIKPSFSDENKQARFLLHLFSTKAYASFIKAKRLFRKTFPQSKYDEIVDYAEADVWIQLWKKEKRKEFFNKAIGIYKKMIQRHPSSKIAERTLIYTAMLAHSEKKYFLATKLLKRYLAKNMDSPFVESARIYLADTLAHMNNFSGALEELSLVAESNQLEAVEESYFRKGDVYFLQQDYRRAQRFHSQAIEKYPDSANKYPNAWFNLAESQFNLAEYPESLKTYKAFFKRFPMHRYSAYALTRIGELVDILTGDRHRAQGFFNESFFRFRDETGGYVARIRSLSQRFKGMSPKQLEAAIVEIKEREKEINISQVDEFTAFMISDGYYWRGNFMKAANALIGYFQKNPKPVNILKFEKRISRSIAGEVKGLIEKENVVPALSIVENHQKSWLSKSRRVDVQYFRAQSIEKLGLTADAHKSYQRLLKRMIQLVDSKEEKERKVFEYYPTFDSVLLRLAVTGYHSGRVEAAQDYLTKVSFVDRLKPDERHDYFVTKSKLSYDKKDYASAMSLVESVRDIPIPQKEKRDKYFVYLSSVYEKNGRFSDAIAILEDYHKASQEKGDKDQIYILSRLFHLFKQKGMAEKAIETGRKLLADYGEKHDLDKERYYLGEVLYQSQKMKEAQLVWKNLERKGLWAELAKNKMDSEDWKKQTEESMKRIPAMAK